MPNDEHLARLGFDMKTPEGILGIRSPPREETKLEDGVS
jgi:hypothetical protein